MLPKVNATVARNVFLAPGSKEHINKSVMPLESFETAYKLKSIEGIIPLDNIADVLTQEEVLKLKEIYPDRKVRLWGARPGLKNVWDSLEVGDHILFYNQNSYICVADAAFKTANTALAKKIWGEYKTGETWENIFFVKNVKELNLPRKTFNKIAGYSEDFIPQGFMKVRNQQARDAIVKEIVLGQQGQISLPTGQTVAAPSFFFEDRDFESCTGKEDDAKYLKKRFLELLNILKPALGSRFANFKSYCAKSAIQPKRGQKTVQYRNHMWLGFAHPKFKRAQEGVQFQVTIDRRAPFSIDIWIDRTARRSRKMAKENVEKSRGSFERLLKPLMGYTVCLRDGYQFEKRPTELAPSSLEEFTTHMTDKTTHVSIRKVLSKGEVLSVGTRIVNIIVDTFNELLPTYFILAGEPFLVTEIAPLSLKTNLIRTKLRLSNDFLSQICASVNAGNHVVITGPVGTGKTSIAEDICRAAFENNFCSGYVLTTATSDWTTFDTIGGYMPTEKGALVFEEGKFLQAIREDKWLIIDEINRADIDKAFGQLFTVLSGQRVELPFKLAGGKTISIESTDEDRSYFDDRSASYKVGKNWRIIATMNIYDMDFLFEMSYAFMRRFAFIYLEIPEKFEELIEEWCRDKKISPDTVERMKQLTKLSERKIGPAIIKDIVEYIQRRGDGEKELAEAIVQYVLPQLEGLEEERIRNTWQAIGRIFENKDIANKIIRPIFGEIVGSKLEEIA